jgi:catechol 2,3-dioxygenase-like lactoylglutathione lyase family enzyme
MKLTTFTAPFVFVLSLHAQLAAPNAAGVAMGHIHINTADVAAQKKFWVDVIGATPVKLGTNEGVKIPGAVILFKAAAPTGPTDGSVINHIGLFIADPAPYAAKLNAAGWKFTDNPKTHQMMVAGPDGVKVELSVDAAATVPVRFHHIHYYTADPVATQAWYAEKFGATKGKRASWEAGDIPGANLTYAKASDPVAPTVGRAIDHIGFEVRDLENFCKKLEASGVKFDTPYRKNAQLNLALAFLTDPWGTRIELTEGLGQL